MKRLAVRLLLPMFLFACGGSGDASPSSTDSAPLETADDAATIDGAPDVSDTGDAALDARSDACRAQDTKLQAALDKARTSPNALLAVSNPECGDSVYVSGDPTTATVDSLWRIGSLTKTFVSAAILSLEKDGALGLDDALSKWVTGVAGTDGVTVRMLLDHRSGIFDYTEDPTFFADRKHVWAPREIVDFATTHPAYFAPDADFHYSNTNYVLLGMILEAATGKKAGAVLHARAIDLAGLGHTFLDGEDTLVGTLATGFASNGTTDYTYRDDPSEAWTAGAMVTSGADLVHWIATLYGSTTVLDDAQHAELKSKTSPFGGTGSGVSYGLGVELTDASLSPAGAGWGHDGSIDGYHSIAFYFPAKKTALAAIVNRDGKDPNVILAAGLTTLFP